jgi:hypothetical protein
VALALLLSHKQAFSSSSSSRFTCVPALRTRSCNDPRGQIGSWGPLPPQPCMPEARWGHPPRNTWDGSSQRASLAPLPSRAPWPKRLPPSPTAARRARPGRPTRVASWPIQTGVSGRCSTMPRPEPWLIHPPGTPSPPAKPVDILLCPRGACPLPYCCRCSCCCRCHHVTCCCRCQLLLLLSMPSLPAAAAAATTLRAAAATCCCCCAVNCCCCRCCHFLLLLLLPTRHWLLPPPPLSLARSPSSIVRTPPCLAPPAGLSPAETLPCPLTSP